ncbi:hypothetical protein PoB_001530300 [Plakobranchus ocellatus]|uniref:ILCR1 Ig-like domain-containing protein n=1 Tax=Plakobranchus ocellatus TaxID=259542 RepID=A0AAV3Z2G7_9GAST|nr:hypothetical protein PoB_001530300 [Plakobranchus ocellatus]
MQDEAGGRIQLATPKCFVLERNSISWRCMYPEGCRSFVQTFSRSDLPAEFKLKATDRSVDGPRPGSLQILAKWSEYTHKGRTRFIPGMYIKWSSPVKRWFVIIYQIAFLLCEKTWLHFQSDIPYISPNKHYTVRVYSMPPPENLAKSQDPGTFVRKEILSGSVFEHHTSPGSWVPSLSARVVALGTVEVTVGHSPDRFNLSSFEVLLLQRSYSETNVVPHLKLTLTQPRKLDSFVSKVNFTDLLEDQYKVVVNVLDPYHKQAGKCLCWVEAAHGRRHCKLSCGSVASDWFFVPAFSKPSQVSASYAPQPQTFLIIGAAVCAVAILAGLALFGDPPQRRTRETGHPGKQGQLSMHDIRLGLVTESVWKNWGKMKLLRVGLFFFVYLAYTQQFDLKLSGLPSGELDRGLAPYLLDPA